MRAAAAAVLLALCACSPERGFEVTRTYEAEGAVIHLRVERTELSVAQTLLVRLEAEVPAGVTPRMPVNFDDVPPPDGHVFEVQDTGEDKPRPVRRDRVRFARWYRVEPFLSGDYNVPPLTVDMVDASGGSVAVRTESVGVRVSSLLPEDYRELDIRDIQGILRPPWRAPPGLLAVLGILGVATLGTGVWLWIQKRARDRWTPPPRPAHEIALEDLEALVREDLVARGEIKKFYQRVTLILRRYVEGRFGLRAPERTTEESLGELGGTDVLTDELKKLLRVFLQHADLVKFAQLHPLGDEIERTLSSCRDFVMATRPPEPARAL